MKICGALINWRWEHLVRGKKNKIDLMVGVDYLTFINVDVIGTDRTQ